MSPSEFLLYTLLATLVLVSSSRTEPEPVTAPDNMATTTRTPRTPPSADPPSFPPHFKAASDAAVPESPKVEPLCFGFSDLFPPTESASPVTPTPSTPITPPAQIPASPLPSTPERTSDYYVPRP